MMNTAIVDAIVSWRVGHETLRASDLTSRKYCNGPEDIFNYLILFLFPPEVRNPCGAVSILK